MNAVIINIVEIEVILIIIFQILTRIIGQSISSLQMSLEARCQIKNNKKSYKNIILYINAFKKLLIKHSYHRIFDC